MAYVDRVLVVFIGRELDQPSFTRHLEMLARDIDTRPLDAKVAVLYDCPVAAVISARQRKELAEMLEKRRLRLQLTTAVYAMATSSAIARGLLRGVFWLSPPPYPHHVVDTSIEAFRAFRQYLPDIDPDACERAYRKLLADHARALGTSAARAS